MRIEIIESLKAILGKHLVELKQEQSRIQDSANNETKSSMGDKYETGRAMAQNEIEKLSLNIADLQSKLSVLEKIQSVDSDVAKIGSLIVTDKDILFIAIAYGQINVNTKNVSVISPISPLGKLFIGKKVNETLEFNGLKRTILELVN